MKWCPILGVAWKRCPIVFQGYPSNFKVTRDKYHWFWAELSVSGLSLQFELTDGFKMVYKAWSGIEEVPYCFSRSSIKFQGHMDRIIDDLNPILSKITRLVAAIKSLRFALFFCICLFLTYLITYILMDISSLIDFHISLLQAHSKYTINSSKSEILCFLKKKKWAYLWYLHKILHLQVSCGFHWAHVL